MPVYFIQAENFGAVKIGFAKDVANRVKSLQAAYPHKLRVLRELDGNMLTEHWLHRHYASQRVHGEWFEYSPDMFTVNPPDVQKLQNWGPIRKTYVDRISAALKRRAPETGLTEWRNDQARCLGVGVTAFENWFYGTGNLPSLKNWAGLRELLPGISDEVVDGITNENNQNLAARLHVVANELGRAG